MAAGAIAVAVWLLPQFAAERVFAVLAARLEAETGLRLTATGLVEGTWLPRPTLRAAGISVTRTNSQDVVAQAASAEAEFAWPGLAALRLDATRVDIRQVKMPAAPAMPSFDIESRMEGFDIRIAVLSETVTARLAVRRAADGLNLDAISLRAGAFVASGEGRLTTGDGARLVLRFDRITRDGAAFGSFAVAGSHASDGVLLERATFRRADGAEISLFGHAVVEPEAVRIEGGIEAGAAASNAEAAARLSGVYAGSTLQLDIADIDARAGAARLTGMAQASIGARSRMKADLRVDVLDLDANPILLGALAAPLLAVDAMELRLRVGRAAWIGLIGEGIIIDAVGEDGVYDLRELAMRSLAGAPLRVEARITPRPDATIAIERLTFRHGAVDGSGRTDIRLGGTRPKIEAVLTTGPLSLDPVLGGPPAPPPEPMTRRAAAAAAAAQRAPVVQGWSREKVALPPLPVIDADLTLATPRLVWRSARLDGAILAARLIDGAIFIDDLSGTSFGGRLTARGKLEMLPKPSFGLAARLAGADLRAILRDFAGVDAVTGRSEMSADLTGSGDSAAEMIAALAGEVRLATRDGVMTGFDLPAVSDRMKRLNRATDMLELARAGAGGRTPFSSLDGVFRVERGIARTDGLVLTARGGEARLRGTINLPAWTLDLANELHVTEPAGLPPLVVRLNGPIASPRSVFDFERLQTELLRRGRNPGR